MVVGGGFIGLEMAENLMHLGLDTSVVEMLPQVGTPGLVALNGGAHDDHHLCPHLETHPTVLQVPFPSPHQPLPPPLLPLPPLV